MTTRNLGDETTTMTAEGAELKLERVYDAPRAKVWGALTSAEQIPSWWGPAGATVKVGEMDVRTGGKWQISLSVDGFDVTFSGEFKEVVDGEKYVRTSVTDGPEEAATVDTVTLTEDGGKTTLKHSTTFSSAEVLDSAVDEFGVGKNMLELYGRLADAVK